jgi:hypothetical protein
MDSICPLQEQSVNTISDYRLDDRGNRVRSPAEAKNVSSSLCVQTQPPAQWVPGVFSSGLNSGQGVTLTTHPI